MQCFNRFNSKNIDYPGFKVLCLGICFWMTFLFTIGIQVVIVQFSGLFMNVVPMNGIEYGVCIAFGVFTFVWGELARVILPASCFECMTKSKKE